MICSDIWHKYHKWYFKLVMYYVISRAVKSEIWDNFEISQVVLLYAKYHIQIMLLFVYTTTHKFLV